MGVPARKGRERASREAIDSENGVIRCANTASPPFGHFSVGTDGSRPERVS
jgi:hypothetical protein